MAFLDSNGVETLSTAIKQEVLNTIVVGATSSAAGAAGLVPAPAMGDQNKFLRGDVLGKLLAAQAMFLLPAILQLLTLAHGLIIVQMDGMNRQQMFMVLHMLILLKILKLILI